VTRLLKVITALDQRNRELDRLRIYDYFFLFINEISIITLPHAHTHYKKLLPNNRYNRVQNSKYAFAQLQSVQDIAMKALAAYDFIDNESLDTSTIIYRNPKLPEQLLSHLSVQEKEYLEFVKNYFETLSLKELKQRTKLMDHRYELS
jgi:hypothetical protein